MFDVNGRDGFSHKKWKQTRNNLVQIRSDQSLSHVRLFATPWIEARQASQLPEFTDSMDVSLSELLELVMDREAWRAAIHGVAKSQTRSSDWSDLTYIPVATLIYIHICSHVLSPSCDRIIGEHMISKASQHLHCGINQFPTQGHSSSSSSHFLSLLNYSL